jgi:hypothetical protein
LLTAREKPLLPRQPLLSPRHEEKPIPKAALALKQAVNPFAKPALTPRPAPAPLLKKEIPPSEHSLLKPPAHKSLLKPAADKDKPAKEITFG